MKRKEQIKIENEDLPTSAGKGSGRFLLSVTNVKDWNMSKKIIEVRKSSPMRKMQFWKSERSTPIATLRDRGFKSTHGCSHTVQNPSIRAALFGQYLFIYLQDMFYEDPTNSKANQGCLLRNR